MKTNFSKDKLSDILSNYNLGNLINSSRFTSGTVQTNILLETDKNRYVLRYYKQGRSLNSVLFEVNLINYLKRKKYPCPSVFKNSQGNFIGLYNNKPYVIFEFIEGEHLEKPNNEQTNELIKKIAELQVVTKKYKPSQIKYRLNYGIESCKDLAVKEAEKIGTPNSVNKLNWLKNELSKLILPKSLAKGICHCDFHFTNVLFKNNKFKALIDFDDANYTYLMFDLVWLINTFKKSFEWNTWSSFSKTDSIFDFREAKQMVSEYSKHRQLSNNEKCHFFDLYKLSILIDSVWYFERGDVKDFFEKRKIDSLNNLGRDKFHNIHFG